MHCEFYWQTLKTHTDTQGSKHKSNLPQVKHITAYSIQRRYSHKGEHKTLKEAAVVELVATAGSLKTREKEL